MAELVRENEELREEVKNLHCSLGYVIFCHVRYLNIALDDCSYICIPMFKIHFLIIETLADTIQVERRRQEVEGLLRERGEGWRSRGRSEETLYESLSYRELQGEQHSKSWKEQVLFMVKVDKLWVKAGCQESPN